MRAWLPLPLSLLLMVGFSTGCARRATPVEDGIRTKTLLLGNGAEPRDLDPEICNAFTDYNILIALYEGLTCIDEKTSQAVPGTAESWDVSPDGLVYTFHLRANARWSNGDPVTADDFAYSFHRILSPGLGSEYAYMLYFLKNAEAFNDGKIADFSQVGVKVLDPRTLQLVLEHPCPFLPAVAAHQAWYPVHRATIEKFGKMDQQGTRWTRPGNIVSNGPFLLQEWSQNARIVVVKNPFYWDAAHNRLNAVVFYPNDDIATDESNFRTGQVHVTYDLLPDRIARYRRESPQLLRIDPFCETFFLRFNVTR
ncbi:MAG TPA: peptide ABC transporter substrate-binding protein, partial [Opitutaceae bacterium]|nr:peptide ABC transporter substrate-binding protein [Opitutaceae bacterium]